MCSVSPRRCGSGRGRVSDPTLGATAIFRKWSIKHHGEKTRRREEP
jgi:hypothetical protein